MKREIENPKKVMSDRFASLMKMDKYKYIMENVYKVDVSSDVKFQNAYCKYYAVAHRNKNWKKYYFELLEKSKHEDLSYESILKELYEVDEKTIEASFASKICATLDPNMPILDKYVLKFLGKKLPYNQSENRIENTIHIYEEIQDWYKEYLKTDNAKECIALFDELFPDYQWVSDVKKIDFYLWSIREDEI